jgi:glycogen(starch) synthase
VVPRGERVGLRFNGGDAEHLGVMIERLLVDVELRERLVTEASEHVLRFDWDDVASRTCRLYSELGRPAAREGAPRR